MTSTIKMCDVGTQTAPFKARYRSESLNRKMVKEWGWDEKLPGVNYIAMRSENRRLETFKCVQISYQRARLFSASGFFCVYSGDFLQCVACRLIVPDQEYWDDNIMKEHEDRNECPIAERRKYKGNIKPIFTSKDEIPDDFVAYEPFDVSDYVQPSAPLP